MQTYEVVKQQNTISRRSLECSDHVFGALLRIIPRCGDEMGNPLTNFLVFAPVVRRGWTTRLHRLGYWPCGAQIGQWKKKDGVDDGGDGEGGGFSLIFLCDCHSFHHRHHLRALERELAAGFAR